MLIATLSGFSMIPVQEFARHRSSQHERIDSLTVRIGFARMICRQAPSFQDAEILHAPRKGSSNSSWRDWKSESRHWTSCDLDSILLTEGLHQGVGCRFTR